MRKKLTASLLAVLLISTAQAQDLYVTDRLRLSLYEQADSRSKVIQLLVSGDKLVVEETSGPYSKVTTSAGNQGWVKRGFLVSEPTASLLLADLKQENESLEQELEKLNGSKIVLDQYEKDMDAMSEKIAGLEREKRNSDQTILALNEAADEKRQQEKNIPILETLIKIGTLYWQYLGAIILFILVVGFMLGKKTTEATVKRRFNGIKIW